MFHCPACSDVFSYMSELLEHKTEHHWGLIAEGKYEESVEHKRFETPIQNASEPSELVNHCSMCDHAYNSESVLQDHIIYMHTMQSISKSGGETMSRSQCPYCTNSYMRSSDLKVSRQSLT